MIGSLKVRCVCMWRGTSTLQALSQKGGEMETSRYFSSLASGRRSRGPGQPGVSPEQLLSHRGVCRAIKLEGASVPGWVLWAPPLGLPWRRSRDGASSLIPAGPEGCHWRMAGPGGLCSRAASLPPPAPSCLFSFAVTHTAVPLRSFVSHSLTGRCGNQGDNDLPQE